MSNYIPPEVLLKNKKQAKNSRLTSNVERSIEIAQAIAKENYHAFFSAPHLLKGLMHNEVGLAATLTVWGKDIYYIREWADIRIEDLPKSGGVIDAPKGDEKIASLFEMADMERMKLGEEMITPLAILAAMCKPGLVFSKEQLKSFPITEKELLEGSIKETAIRDAIQPTEQSSTISSSSQTKAPSLYQYCIDKIGQAKLGEIDSITGRDKEMRAMIEILGKRNKPNPILIGEPGVGKTAMVEGLALNIARGNVSDHLKDALLFELDMGALIAGASYKGEIEDRLKKIIKEIKQFNKAILFIDELHILLDPKAGLGGAANLLKPELARRSLTVIGATTGKEYREFIENNSAFSSRFEKVIIEEPDEETAIRMIENIVPKYEAYHGISVTKSAVSEAVTLSKRYISDKCLPDSAIDLIDTTTSAMKMMANTSSREIEKLEEELASMNSERSIEDYRWMHKQLENRLSPVLLGQLEDVPEFDTLQGVADFKGYIERNLQELKQLARQRKEEVDADDIAAIVAVKTGVPIGKVKGQERERLLNMEANLKRRVVGQDQALSIVSQAIWESRAGLKKPGQPVGSFFFCGPTGTGKTELAKSLAEFLFNDENALIRFDMSEFKESNSAALLYGASPGYVGYKEGGLLVNKIRQSPYSVILFDEIEKAHDSIYDVFLQILDDGVMTDKQGRKGDFSNAIILFTSNLGYKKIAQYAEKKEKLPDSKKVRKIMKSLKKKGKPNESVFRPEFVGRMDAFVPFAPVTEKVALIIFNIQVQSLIKALKRQGIHLEITPDAAAFLTQKGYNPDLGARPILSVIRTELRQPLAKMLISEELTEGDTVKVRMIDNQLEIGKRQ